MDSRRLTTLKAAVERYARDHANADGLALTPIPGLRMMYVTESRGPLQSTYKPLVCLVLQGAKHMLVGLQEITVREGLSVLVTADMPVAGRIIDASPEQPYLAVAVVLDRAILRDLVDQLPNPPSSTPATDDDFKTSHVERTVEPLLECALRLMNLLDSPGAIDVLHPLILRELHYWLLSGSMAPALMALTIEDSRTARLTAAIRIMREEFRSSIRVERLARAAAMGLTAFHQHFKNLTSLTPVQYQKRLRLIEARQLIQDKGWLASHAAFEVGYESVSQFTRDYARLFGAPPKRDALRQRRKLAGETVTRPTLQ